MLQKKWLLALVGAGLLVVGMAGGVVLASNLNANASTYANSPTTTNAYCQLYLSTVASKLNTSSSAVSSANQAGLQAVLNQMVKDGKITSAQEAKLQQRLATLSQHPCALIGRLAGHGRGPANGALAGAQASALSAVANALHLSTTTLQSDLASGKTIAQLATAQSVQVSAVNTAYLNAIQTQLNAAVANKVITQTQATNLYTKVQQAVASGKYPLLMGRGHRGPLAAPAGA